MMADSLNCGGLGLRLAEEEVECARAVVLRDEGGDLVRQPYLARELEAVGDVAGDDARALLRPEAVVRVVAGLVLDEVFGRGQLADVVVEGADAREQGVGADGAASLFGELADGVRVLVRAGRAQGQLAEDGQVGVREFEQANVRQDAEERFVDGEQAAREDGRQESSGERAGRGEEDGVERQRLLRREHDGDGERGRPRGDRA